ncbi:hypothetical protein K1T71_000193, partial [Dendrolimus kikuchii]
WWPLRTALFSREVLSEAAAAGFPVRRTAASWFIGRAVLSGSTLGSLRRPCCKGGVPVRSSHTRRMISYPRLWFTRDRG